MAVQSGHFRTTVVLGAGAWGTALAQVAARAGQDVRLWGRDQGLANAIRMQRENPKYLPGVELEASIVASTRICDCASADLVLLVTPAQTLRGMCASMEGVFRPDVPIVICAKGIERETGKFVTEVVAEVLPRNPVAILSGPSFAGDVASGLPTAVTIAAHDEGLARTIGNILGTQSFRLYHTNDVRGVEIGGAAKNVLAIGCGIVDGLQLGASAKAALIARGFAELRRFGAAFGATQETLMGLSGLGDLVLTCSSPQSRNYALGLSLGTGKGKLPHGKLAEGAFTAQILCDMARRQNIDMPIADAVDKVLRDELTIDEAISSLMMRPQKSETFGAA